MYNYYHHRHHRHHRHHHHQYDYYKLIWRLLIERTTETLTLISTTTTGRKSQKIFIYFNCNPPRNPRVRHN